MPRSPKSLVETRSIVRAFAAFFGSGAISDIWPRLDRSYMFAIYVYIVFAGPLLASIIGPILIDRYRVTIFPVQITFISFVWGIAVLLMPETYVPVILYWKARQFRKLTRQLKFKAPIELKRVKFRRRMKHDLNRPFRFLYKDRMLTLVVAYTGLNYIITYQMFSAVPLLYSTDYKFDLLMWVLLSYPPLTLLQQSSGIIGY
ncbi:conserved hypothetical protein [Talaromyces stipitatus ATCC 10500]|uniref:Major facilitator superfamily (MFS) profile domain-containing protein n=1 Tax=Talaromyces stipitatus (strain ATCC 10500 / CBS 375.48 / QM 6759 / NRRL 1006) TaxID=441959 RepID=B8MLF8_TALSN|nr:uncharacterized protein TSTA_049280 [Talaromyces stipitatus ATCC 10500]EED15491.1 conserved hypothetical protein [Talaromyces stipitatus ATCC 10500]